MAGQRASTCRLVNQTQKRRIRRPINIFYGWWIVAISAMADALKHGTFNRGITLYILPIRSDLGFSIAAISLAEALGRLEGGLQGPLIGYLTDRVGPRSILIFGALASGLGFMLLAGTQSYLYFVLVYVGLLSMGFRAGYNNATIPAVNQWFRRQRSLAMSVASMGNGIGGAAIAPLAGVLVLTVGWRPAAIISGIAIIVVVVPLAFFLRRSPEDMGLTPDGDRVPPPSARAVQVQREAAGPTGAAPTGPLPWDDDFTAKEAMKTPSYWLLVLAVGLRNTVHSGMSFLLAPVIVWYLQGGGRTEDEAQPIAVAFVGVLSLAAIVLNPMVGWLGDRWDKQRISSACMLGGALSLIVLLDHTGRIWQLAVFVVFLAFSETANPLSWAIMGDFFGRRSFATLRGWQHLPDQLMSMSTPVWMGVVVGQTGSYKWALIPLVIIYCFAAFFYWTIPRPKAPVRHYAR